MVCKFVSIFILDVLKNFGLFGFHPILKSYGVMKSIYTYKGYIIFGIINYFCFKERKKINENNDLNILASEEDLIMDKSKNTYLQIFLVCFCLHFF